MTPQDDQTIRPASSEQTIPEGAGTSRFMGGEGGDHAEERRRGADRRQSTVEPDARGYINTPNYTGPERRSGLDRRAYMERQRQIVREEQARFIQRSVITGTIFFVLIVLAGVFLLAPEYVQLKRRAEVAAAQPPAPAPAPEAPAAPLGYTMNQQIQRVEAATEGLSATTQAMINRAGDAGAVAAETARQLAEGDATGLRELVEFIGHAHTMASTPEGRAQLDASVDYLKSALGSWQGDAAGFQNAIAAARGRDPALNGMLSSVAPQDVGAAAMLLLMGEFRGNVHGGRPFDQDLAVVQKLAGSNPGLQQSLAKLAPYAKSGVLTPSGLQREFKGLAMDIVTAKAAGQDVSVTEQAKARLQGLVKVRRTDDMEGASADAAVNRAQALLDRGDVAGAIAELQALQGPQAAAAAPFIQQAQGTLAAGSTAEMMISGVLSQLAAGGGVDPAGLQGLIGGSLGMNPSGPVSPVSGQ
jgi:hypothetical protein